MKLTKPLEVCYVTQPFGVDWTHNGLYEKLGMKGHNGIDYRARIGTPCFACFDGTINDVWEDEYGGKGVTIISECGKFEAVYFHLSEFGNVKGGMEVKAGQEIGKTGNTGKYCYGAHLHFGLKTIPKIYSNGYHGMRVIVRFMREFCNTVCRLWGSWQR